MMCGRCQIRPATTECRDCETQLCAYCVWPTIRCHPCWKGEKRRTVLSERASSVEGKA